MNVDVAKIDSIYGWVHLATEKRHNAKEKVKILKAELKFRKMRALRDGYIEGKSEALREEALKKFFAREDKELADAKAQYAKAKLDLKLAKISVKNMKLQIKLMGVSS